MCKKLFLKVEHYIIVKYLSFLTFAIFSGILFSLPSLQTLVESENPGQYLAPVDSLFAEYPQVILTANQEKRCRNGNAFSVKLEDGTYRAYSKTGEFLMLAKVEAGTMSTVKSFFDV